MRRWLLMTALTSILFPLQTFAYFPSRFTTKKNCDPPHTQNLRRSRRLLLNDMLTWSDAHHALPSGLLPYQSPDEGLRLRYPAAWTMREHLFGTLVSFLSPVEGDHDRIRENINILLKELPDERPSLQEFTAGTMRYLLRTSPSIAVLASEGKLLGDGITAHAITYEDTTRLGRMKFRQVWAIVGNRAILLTFTATPDTFERYEEAFETVLRTVQVTM